MRYFLFAWERRQLCKIGVLPSGLTLSLTF